MIPSLILAFSNIFGLPAIIKALAKNDHSSLAMIYVIIFSGFMMHMTESKHHFTSVIFPQYSNFFLWIDRINTVLGIFYFFPKYWKSDRKLSNLVEILAILGIFSSLLGEQKTEDKFFNNIIYPGLHLFWHLCVYSGIYLLI